MSGRDGPTVSVIMPAHDAVGYIRRALCSALDQSLGEIEVVVVDDASTDGTAKVVSEIGDPRVRLFRNASNVGPSGSRNRAIELARGEWIAVLDADDWYAPRRLERLLAVAHESGCDMVADDVYQIHDGAPEPWCTQLRLGGVRGRAPFEVDAETFLASNMPGLRRARLGGMRPLVRRTFLMERGLRYEEGLSYAEDFHFYFHCLLAGARFTIVPEAFYYRRNRHGGLATANRTRNLRQSLRTNSELLGDARVSGNPRLTRLLEERQRLIVEGLELEEVRGAVARGAWRETGTILARRPRMIAAFLRRVPLLLRLRWSRAWGGV